MAEKGFLAAIVAFLARVFGGGEQPHDAQDEFGNFFGRSNGPASGGIEGR